jgi:hypothetical protein
MYVLSFEAGPMALLSYPNILEKKFAERPSSPGSHHFHHGHHHRCHHHHHHRSSIIYHQESVFTIIIMAEVTTIIIYHPSCIINIHIMTITIKSASSSSPP